MNTPDAAVDAFLASWHKRDWPTMVRACQRRRVAGGRVTPHSLRDLFGDKVLSKGWSIIGHEQLSVARVVILKGRRVGVTPEAIDVRVRIVYRIGGVICKRVLTITAVRENAQGQPAEGDESGSWGVNESSALREALDSAVLAEA